MLDQQLSHNPRQSSHNLSSKQLNQQHPSNLTSSNLLINSCRCTLNNKTKQGVSYFPVVMMWCSSWSQHYRDLRKLGWFKLRLDWRVAQSFDRASTWRLIDSRRPHLKSDLTSVKIVPWRADHRYALEPWKRRDDLDDVRLGPKLFISVQWGRGWSFD